MCLFVGAEHYPDTPRLRLARTGPHALRLSWRRLAGRHAVVYVIADRPETASDWLIRNWVSYPLAPSASPGSISPRLTQSSTTPHGPTPPHPAPPDPKRPNPAPPGPTRSHPATYRSTPPRPTPPAQLTARLLSLANGPCYTWPVTYYLYYLFIYLQTQRVL